LRPQPGAPAAHPAPPPLARPIPAKPLDDEPLELVEDDFEEKPITPIGAPATAAPGTATPGAAAPGAAAPAHAPTEPPKSKIHGISSAGSLVAHSYKRPTHSNKTGAVRMRTFHCRLSEQGVEYLDQTVNDWLEHHPEIEIKFTNSTIGLWDGKLKEPTLIINVWY
jgi:hypothetical protein